VVGWKPWEADNDVGAGAWKRVPIDPVSDSEDRTLGVPVGWNKPTSQIRRRFVGRLRKPVDGQRGGGNPRCREVLVVALKGEKPRKALGLKPTMVRGHTL